MMQLGFNNVFLNHVLKKEIFIDQPLGLISYDTSHLVCKPHKVLYDFNQVPNVWFERLYKVLTDLDFKCSKVGIASFTRLWVQIRFLYSFIWMM